MYGWINDHFGLGFEKPILERDFEPALKADLTVWDDAHPQPAGGENFERALMKLWADITDSQMNGWLAGDQQQVARLSQLLEQGWRASLGLTTTTLEKVRVSGTAARMEIFSTQLPQWTLWTAAPETPAPASESQATDASPASSVATAAESHQTVMEDWTRTPRDLHFVVSNRDGQAMYFFPVLTEQRDGLESGGGEHAEQAKYQAIVKNPRLAAAYTFGYNLPLFAQRAQQIGLTLQWLASQQPNQRVTVHGQGSNAALAAAGVFVAQHLMKQAGDSPVTFSLKIQPGDFAFSRVGSIRAPDFLPGSGRFWGLPGLTACLAADIELESTAVDDYQRLSDLITLAGGALRVK